MTAYSPTCNPSRKPLGFSLLLLAALLMAITGVIVVGGQRVRLRSHAAESHALDEHTADQARAALARPGCPYEKYLSPKLGQVLFLCPMPTGAQWAGMIVAARLPAEATLEITAWVAPRWRWQEIIARDGYAPIPVVP